MEEPLVIRGVGKALYEQQISALAQICLGSWSLFISLPLERCPSYVGYIIIITIITITIIIRSLLPHNEGFQYTC